MPGSRHPPAHGPVGGDEEEEGGGEEGGAGQQQDQGRLSYRLRFGDFGDAYPRERPMSSEQFIIFHRL